MQKIANYHLNYNIDKITLKKKTKLLTVASAKIMRISNLLEAVYIIIDSIKFD